jgi:HEAT repeat protein
MSTIDELISDLAHPNRQVSQAAQLALISMGSEAVEPLLDQLPHSDAKQSYEIINVLAKIRDPRAVPIVSECLFADHSAVRLAAAECLGMIGNRRATIPLLKALQESAHSGVQLWIVQALGRLADSRSIDALLSVMQTTDSPALRYTAIEALGLIGDRRVVEPIKLYLNDASQHVRSRVEAALERLGEGQPSPSVDLPGHPGAKPNGIEPQNDTMIRTTSAIGDD